MTTKPIDAPIPFEVLTRTGDSTRTQAGVPNGIKRTGRFITQVMPVYDRFEPTLQVTHPDAYLVPNDAKIVALLKLHGLTVEPFSPSGTNGRISVFTVDSMITATRAFQGHKETRLTGTWSTPAARDLAAGGYVVVSASGRFGPLAAYLLEPESDDGLVDWNFFDTSLATGKPFPVIRLYR